MGSQQEVWTHYKEWLEQNGETQDNTVIGLGKALPFHSMLVSFKMDNMGS